MNAIETTGAAASTETLVITPGEATPELTVTVPKVVAVKEPKVPSKKSFAVAIFAAKMVERSQGLYASNKDFRAAVLRAIESELSVSTASAATMYNSCKVEAETADTSVGLGRDPKMVKVKVEGAGKRGRPAGSTNKKAVEVVVTDAVAEVVAATEEGSGYAEPVNGLILPAAETEVAELAAPTEAVAA